MGQINYAVKLALAIGASAGAMMFAFGCSDTAPPAQNGAVRSDVTDVRPIEPATPAAYQPPMVDNTGMLPTAAQPVTTETPAISSNPMISSTPVSTIGEKTHKVLRGETLYSIAKAAYGSGKDWKKIVAANPGVSPSKLKVGQVLNLP